MQGMVGFRAQCKATTVSGMYRLREVSSRSEILPLSQHLIHVAGLESPACETPCDLHQMVLHRPIESTAFIGT